MSAAIVSPTYPLNAVPRTLCDNEICVIWYPGSRSSTLVLGECRNADSERGESTIFIAKYIAVVQAIF